MNIFLKFTKLFFENSSRCSHLVSKFITNTGSITDFDLLPFLFLALPFLFSFFHFLPFFNFLFGKKNYSSYWSIRLWLTSRILETGVLSSCFLSGIRNFQFCKTQVFNILKISKSFPSFYKEESILSLRFSN